MSTVRTLARALAPLCLVAAFAGDGAAKNPPDVVETVYLSKEQVLKSMFAASHRVTAERHVLTEEQVAAVEDITGRDIPETSYVFYIGWTGTHVDGYALIDDQRGKYHPITFAALIAPDGTVERVEVMIYRESIGDGVRHQRFLKQFYGTDADDAQKYKRRIRHVTGATISSRSMMKGVARALALWEVLYKHAPPTPPGDHAGTPPESPES